MTEHEEDKLVLKVDYKNAFNSIRRDVIMSKVKEEVPALYKMVWQTYSTASYLYFNEEVILSQEGVQEGDPLGPFLFSLGVRELMNSCSSESNIGYLDDATLADKPEIVLADLKKK